MYDKKKNSIKNFCLEEKFPKQNYSSDPRKLHSIIIQVMEIQSLRSVHRIKHTHAHTHTHKINVVNHN